MPCLAGCGWSTGSGIAMGLETQNYRTEVNRPRRLYRLDRGQ